MSLNLAYKTEEFIWGRSPLYFFAGRGSKMSQEMKSQASDDSDYENNSEEDMDDIYNYYYDNENHDDSEGDIKQEEDPEYFAYELLSVEDVERLLNETVEALCKGITGVG